MIQKQSYFVTAKEGTTLMRDGKSIGAAVWLAAGLGYDNIENIGGVESRPMIFPENGKVLKHKTTGELSDGCWLKDSTADDWDEIERPAEESEE